MRLVFFAILALCLPLGLISVVGQSAGDQNGGLTGDVADITENAPLSRAFVYVHTSKGGDSRSVKVDPSGRFALSLPPGYYDVFVAADGFAPTCKRLRVISKETTHFGSRLRADVEHAEQDSQ